MTRKFIQIYQNHKRLFYIYFSLVTLFSICIAIFSNKDFFLTLNSLHSPALDDFFLAMTNLGDGEVTVFIGIIIVGIHFYKGIGVLSTFFLSSVITQFFKRVIFYDIERPAKVFEHTSSPVHFIEGYEISYYHSFPSGHTTTVFGLSIFLILVTKNNYIKTILFLFACTSAYSRIYLGQHFPIDVVAGSLVGFGSAIAVYTFLQKRLII